MEFTCANLRAFYIYKYSADRIEFLTDFARVIYDALVELLGVGKRVSGQESKLQGKFTNMEERNSVQQNRHERYSDELQNILILLARLKRVYCWT